MMNLKKIKPMFTSILVTKNTFKKDVMNHGIIEKKAGDVKEYQKVIAIGESVRGIKEGDIVFIDPKRYAVKKYQENSIKSDLMENTVVHYNIPIVTMDGIEYMLLDNNDIKYVIEEYEEEPDSDIIIPNKNLIL